jgi:hypothetical protein
MVLRGRSGRRTEIAAQAARPKRKRTNATCGPGSRTAAALAITAITAKTREETARMASAEAPFGLTWRAFYRRAAAAAPAICARG